MFETLSHYALQQYWYVIVSLLGSLLVFLMFVQGGQTLIYTLGKNKTERSILVNSLGRKWEFTFTTLVTFGGAFFASFPLFYATSFGGAYWVWILILFAFIIQAISYEFRSKPGNFLGSRTYETFLFTNGLLGTILLGTAVATFFTGSNFQITENNFSEWMNPYRGLELAFDFSRYATYVNLSLGFAVFFLARVLGILYFMNNVDEDNILERARRKLIGNAVPFLAFFLFFLINILVREGFAVNPETGNIFMEPYKYLNNFLEMPWLMGIFLPGILLVLAGIAFPAMNYEKHGRKGIWMSGSGTVLTVLGLFLTAGLNNTAFYPSVYDLQSSLTIRNASSSHYTLATMGYVSLLVPFVMAYIWYAWRAINKKRISSGEISDEHHSY
ncbi:MAG: cytochrome d ubiquinol oxidase subunit II [Bacteroidales bacterium]